MPKGISCKKTFRPYSHNQEEMFPPYLDAMLDKNHPVRFVNDIIDKLDVSDIIKSYDCGGASAFHPKMMIKVIIYGYLCNIVSCRNLERSLKENIAFMWLSGKQFPDFRTINHFKCHRIANKIDTIFNHVINLLIVQRVVTIDNIFVDGTIIESASNRYVIVWKKNTERHLDNQLKRANELLNQIKSDIKKDDSEFDISENIQSITPEMIEQTADDLNKRLSLIEEDLPNASAEKKKELRQNKTKLKEVRSKILPKIVKYKVQLEILENRGSYAKTDKDATAMRQKDDHLKKAQLKPSYNIQISSENQFILNYIISQNPNDAHDFIPHIEDLLERTGITPNTVTADSIYGTEENYSFLEAHNIESYLKYPNYLKESTKKFINDISKQENLYYNDEKDYFICPMGQRLERKYDRKSTTINGFDTNVAIYEASNCKGCPLTRCHRGINSRQVIANHNLRRLKKQARENLMSEIGIILRKRRACEVESIFGNLKWNNKFKRFTYRGLEKVNMEFGLFAIAHNLRKFIKMFFNSTFFSKNSSYFTQAA